MSEIAGNMQTIIAHMGAISRRLEMLENIALNGMLEAIDGRLKVLESQSRRFASLEETRSIHSEMKVSKPGAVEDCIQLEASMLLVENDSEANRLSDSTDNVKVLNEEDSSIMESKYSKLVETPSHANSVIDSCSCVLTRYVRLHEEQLQKLTGEKNFPRTCSGEWLQWEMEDGNRTRIWDPGGS